MTLTIGYQKAQKKSNMCFFDQHRFACGDWKWGHFRQHCNREYRTGETCGMKLIMQTVPVTQKCKLCDKIDTKQRRRSAELDRINRWKREGNKFRASIDRSTDMIKVLDREIFDLGSERQRRLQAIWNGSHLLGNFGGRRPLIVPSKRGGGGGFRSIDLFFSYSGVDLGREVIGSAERLNWVLYLN